VGYKFEIKMLMNSISKWALVCVGLAAIASCNQCNDSAGTDMAGGPCSYDEYRIPARIIVFDVLDSASVDVTMVLDSNEHIPPPYDTLSFYMETGRFMTVAEADSLQLKKGKALTYLLQRIKTGACNPEINTLLLEPME
jgi:hypothetical protein